MRIINDAIRPVAAFLLAAVIANCNEACIPGYKTISPANAYAMEISGCVSKRNKEVLKCANEAGDMKVYEECKADADERDRQCRAQVDRKYFDYNGNGEYPK